MRKFMKLSCLAVGLLFISFPIHLFADECVNEWTFSQGANNIAKIRACAYSSGNSGYYELENLTGDTVRMCWEMTFNDGRSDRGCRPMNPYEKSRGSCFSCAPRNSGVADIDLTSFDRK